ncbi:DUF1570 domain-containing protein [Brevundimonas sp.]|uniref:DUF1570 domain-containing protein n=1 Tax=Brevundimonas sp. TaxID=1871086 RepID=UPI003D13F145
MSKSLRTLIGAMAAALTLVAAAVPAHAEWRRAESPRFIVYSQGGERELRDYVRKLETYDWLLRARFGRSPDDAPMRKLPIYLVDGRAGIQQVTPNASALVAGTYFPTEEDIFAIAVRGDDDDYMLHEYAHHFFFQNEFATGYPAWLVEGLAEYFMTAEISAGSVEVGRANTGRVATLTQNNATPLSDLLTLRFADVRGSGARATYYPMAWLLTHWFLSDEARGRQLRVYLADLGNGGDPVEAIQRATGLSLEELRVALRAHITSGLPFTRYQADFPQPEITVTALPRSADDLLLVGQRLKVGVADDQRAATVALVRTLAARYPDDSFAQLQLGHAEIHFGDAAAGEAILTRLLEADPVNVEALQLMATRRMAEAREEPETRDTRIAEARAFLGRAFAADRRNYQTLLLLAQTRVGAANYPNPNDIQTWTYAYQFAPQLPAIRLGFGRALMLTDKPDEAVYVLTPLARSPHGGRTVELARDLIARARGGRPPEDDPASDVDEPDTEPTPPPA